MRSSELRGTPSVPRFLFCASLGCVRRVGLPAVAELVVGPLRRSSEAVDVVLREGQFQTAKVREIIRLIETYGWFLDCTRGSHRQCKHATKRGVVTVAGKPGDDLAPGTLNSILKQSGLK